MVVATLTVGGTVCHRKATVEGEGDRRGGIHVRCNEGVDVDLQFLHEILRNLTAIAIGVVFHSFDERRSQLPIPRARTMQIVRQFFVDDPAQGVTCVMPATELHHPKIVSWNITCESLNERAAGKI